MMYGFGVWNHSRKAQRQVRQLLSIARCPKSPGLIPAVEKTELVVQYRTLNGIHPIVEADFLMFVFADATVIAKAAEADPEFKVVRRHRSTIPKCSQILARIKAETRGAPNGTRPTTCETSAVSLCGVLNEKDALFSADLQCGVEGQGLAIEMYPDHRSTIGCDRMR